MNILKPWEYNKTYDQYHRRGINHWSYCVIYKYHAHYYYDPRNFSGHSIVVNYSLSSIAAAMKAADKHLISIGWKLLNEDSPLLLLL